MKHHDIWVVDRSKLFREGLKLLLQDSPFQVSLEAPEMTVIEDLSRDGDTPALILIALQTPLEPGSDEEITLNQICLNGQAPVVVLSDTMSISQLRAAMRAGASGYLLRDITPDVLKHSLLLVTLGEKVLPSDLTSFLVEGAELRSLNAFHNGQPELSPREKVILRCLAHGHPNKTIANQLNITEGTVKVHIKTVFKKIHAHNRTEAAIWAMNNGLDDNH